MAEPRCGHCGREGTLEQVDDVRLYGQTISMHRESTGLKEADRQVRLVVQCCSGCVKPTLLQYTCIDGWSDPGEFAGLHRIYPEVRDLADLPQRVRTRYQKMLELTYEPDAFAVRAGRLLEAVCSDRGISSGTLEKRLDKLVAGGGVPQALTDQAHLVRDYRNLGGHDEDLEVEAPDVPLIRAFVEALLDFLYFGPAKLERGRAELKRRKAEIEDDWE
jgi:Domain of unknown function (DUF4145)